jgi:hypothetical protein
MTQSIKRRFSGFTDPENKGRDRQELLELTIHAREYLFASRGLVDGGCDMEIML